MDWWSTQARVFWMYLKLAFYPWPLLIHYEMPLAVAGGELAVCAGGDRVGGRDCRACLAQAAGGLSVGMCVFDPRPDASGADSHRDGCRTPHVLAARGAGRAGGDWRVCTDSARCRANAQSPNSFFGGRRLVTAARRSGVAGLILVYARRRALSASAMFREPIVLWEDVVAAQPGSHLAQQGLATELAAVRRTRGSHRTLSRGGPRQTRLRRSSIWSRPVAGSDGQLDESIVHLREVVRLKPDAYKLRNNLGVVLFTAGRLPEAIAEFEKTLELAARFCRGPG